jgi:homogentisate 1,2-dioxygenase
MGLEGFSSLQSLLYHHFLPPRVKRVEDLGPARPEFSEYGPIRHRAFTTADLPAGGDPVSARRALFGNNDVILSISRPNRSMDYAYRNAQAYETWFAHEGNGVLHSQFGRLPFGPGDHHPFQDYLADPTGNARARFFVIEPADRAAQTLPQ